MTKIVKTGENRAWAAAKTKRHAQRTPLPPRASQVGMTAAEIIADELAKVKARQPEQPEQRS
jgi:hypothetical protein